MDHQKLLTDKNIRFAFDTLDTNGDGQIDMEEFKTVFKAQMEKKKIEYDEEKFKQAWAETDKDKSGKLDKAEFEAFVRTLVKKQVPAAAAVAPKPQKTAEVKPVPGKIVFSYFDVYGRGEPGRMMLAHAGADYVDERIK